MAFAGLDFSAGEFPAHGMCHRFATLGGKKKTAFDDERGDDFDRFHIVYIILIGGVGFVACWDADRAMAERDLSHLPRAHKWE